MTSAATSEIQIHSLPLQMPVPFANWARKSPTSADEATVNAR